MTIESCAKPLQEYYLLYLRGIMPTESARLPVRSQREPVLIDLALQGGGNPLNKVLAESVDFARLSQPPIKLFITATNLRTGRGRVFRNAGLRA